MKSERDIIVQYIIKRKYTKQNITLPDKFWNLPKYKEEYVYQMMLAAKLLRNYSFKAILAALEKEKWCFSLAAKKLQNSIEIEEQSISSEEKRLAQKKAKIENLNTKMPLFRKQKNVKEEGQ